MEYSMVTASRPAPPAHLSLEIGPYPFVVQSESVRHTDKIRITVDGDEHEEDCLRMIAEFVQDLAAAGIATE